jgi:hypothetical protein
MILTAVNSCYTDEPSDTLHREHLLHVHIIPQSNNILLITKKQAGKLASCIMTFGAEGGI